MQIGKKLISCRLSVLPDLDGSALQQQSETRHFLYIKARKYTVDDLVALKGITVSDNPGFSSSSSPLPTVTLRKMIFLQSIVVP